LISVSSPPASLSDPAGARRDYLAGYRRQFRALCSDDDFFTAAIEML
jgi:hypothetical protein